MAACPVASVVHETCENPIEAAGGGWASRPPLVTVRTTFANGTGHVANAGMASVTYVWSGTGNKRVLRTIG
jgi:hypothetical protein